MLTAHDRFAPHELPYETLAALFARLDAIEGVHRVYLAKKLLREQEGFIHVLVVVPTPVYVWAQARAARQQERALAIARRLEVPDGVSVHAVADAGSPALKPLRALAGSLVYEAKRRKRERRARRSPGAIAAAL